MKLVKVPLLMLFFLLIVLVVAGGFFTVLAFLNNPTGEVPETGVLFQIKKGETSEHVFVRLEQERLIRSSLLMRSIAKLTNTESFLKSGIYRIRPDQTTLDIHNELVSGKQEMKKVTVKEGWTLSQIAGTLEAAGLMPAGEFMQAAASPELRAKYNVFGRTLEGYLFPDTYFFPYEVSAETVLTTMLDTFYEKLGAIFPDYRQLDKRLLFQKVIIASIVEREYRREDEAPVIASVFFNRLQRNQKLESCATVEYVLTEIMGKPHHERLTWADIAVKSPYNTYEIGGLPPGPIGNPGKTSLIAAFFPMKTNYLYFVLKDPATGVHEFSETFQKHLTAKELYIKSY
jgi:UPF0755 protein